MFVQEVIEPMAIMKWQPRDNVLIKAPTGSGKSYFMLHILARYYEKVNKKVLIFSNRNMLKEQNKKTAYKNIDCFNYQHFERMKEEKLSEELRRYDVICFDECHYFFIDSAFNTKTEKLLRYAIQDTDQVKIFASATPEPLYKTKLNFKYRYDIEEDFSFINSITFYTDIDSQLDEILAQEKKALCFFNSSTKALKFKMKNEKSVSFLCSKGNKLYDLCDKEEMDNIITKNKFSKKILATTTVLDNGVSLIDDDLKIILLDITDPVVLIQSLGRKRLKEGEKISVYMRIPKENEPRINKNLLKQATPKGYYARFLKEYRTKISEVGFARYWLARFNIDSWRSRVDVQSGANIRDFLAQNNGKVVAKEKLAKLLGVQKPMRISTANNLIKNVSPYFYLVSERRYVDGQRKRVWIVKKKHAKSR